VARIDKCQALIANHISGHHGIVVSGISTRRPYRKNRDDTVHNTDLIVRNATRGLRPRFLCRLVLHTGADWMGRLASVLDQRSRTLEEQ
jgi:hypothetical protein